MSALPMIDLKTQYKHIESEVLEAMKNVLDSNQYVNGTAVKNFTSHLENYLGAKAVIPCANGTDALQIALMSLGLKPGDEVITTPFTFVSTAEVIALLGLQVRFIDIYPDTFNMNVEQLQEVASPATACILPVHLFGQCCDMESVLNIAGRFNIPVVEDNAQSIGADYHFSDGKKVKSGLLGDIGCTSFYPTKNLGAYGDGGAIFTQNEKLADKIRMICNHGSSQRYYHDEVGVNSRLDSLQAAVLDIKLKHLDTYNQHRADAAERYNQLLADLEHVITPAKSEFSDHVYHQYTIRVTDGLRDELQKKLQEQGIPSGIYYPVPLHLQKAYRKFGYGGGDFPVSEQMSKEVLSLPMHSELKEEDQLVVATAIKNILGELK
ncbi:MAG TPA: DegT/DnrJ/EryC1/StrS family aminotransferase [Saprospiraceae bacterium]|nr:DegT/DnrJ/EryC1/StrS family aminotransferase [Saprospiraceae bacterium]